MTKQFDSYDKGFMDASDGKMPSDLKDDLYMTGYKYGSKMRNFVLDEQDKYDYNNSTVEYV